MAAPDLAKMSLSPEEAKNMTRLMKDPKFMEMFADYAKEISDPKNKEEMENALRQAENRGEKVPGFPEGKEILMPVAGFCAKTKHEDTGLKVFINVCHSDKIKDANGKERPDKTGTDWDIPYSLAPPREDIDKVGVECNVHDFVVSTKTHKLALEGQRFKKFLVETAIDAIEKQREVKLSRGKNETSSICINLKQDSIFAKLKYKGPNGEPRMLTVSKTPSSIAPCKPATSKNSGSQSDGQNPKRNPTSGSGSKSSSTSTTSKVSGGDSGDQRSSSTADPSPTKSPPKSGSGSGSGNASASASESRSTSTGHPKTPEITYETNPTESSGDGVSSLYSSSANDATTTAGPQWSDENFNKKESGEAVEPKYKIVYRNHLDLAQFWEDRANLQVWKDEIKEIVLHVHLPEVVELSDIELNVSEWEAAVTVPGRYDLKVPLKYTVDPERGQAKFDKNKLLYQLEAPESKRLRYQRIYLTGTDLTRINIQQVALAIFK